MHAPRVLLLFLLATTALPSIVHAVEPWPADGGTEIGELGKRNRLPEAFEPSGAEWHPGLERLILVSDTGEVALLRADGELEELWAPGEDFEAVAVTDPTSPIVYLGREHPDAVFEFDLLRGELTGNEWDLTPWIDHEKKKGLEALTWVNGRFYAGDQRSGDIYVFELLPRGEVRHVETIAAPRERDDLSGLHFNENTGILYALYDSEDLLVEMTLEGRILREYELPEDNQEGIVLRPDCGASRATLFIAIDSGEAWRYEHFPISCLEVQGTR